MTKFEVDGQHRVISDEGKEVFLYSVMVITPNKGTQTHFVFAQDEKAAKGMAECAMGVESYATSADIYELVRTHVTKLPFTIQGWGKHKF